MKSQSLRLFKLKVSINLTLSISLPAKLFRIVFQNNKSSKLADTYKYIYFNICCSFWKTQIIDEDGLNYK